MILNISFYIAADFTSQSSHKRNLCRVTTLLILIIIDKEYVVLVISNYCWYISSIYCPNNNSLYLPVKLPTSWINGSINCFSKDAQRPDLDIFPVNNDTFILT